jgi:hypothetical protein
MLETYFQHNRPRAAYRTGFAGPYLDDFPLWLQKQVAYPAVADKYLGPLASRLSSVNQPVTRPRNAFSTLLPSLLVDISTHVHRFLPRSSTGAVS